MIQTRKSLIYNSFETKLSGPVWAAYRLLPARVPLLLLSLSNRMEMLFMKKNEFSELASNLLIFGSVSLAFLPFVLGDRLVLVVTGLMREGGIMLDQFGNYLSWLVS